MKAVNHNAEEKKKPIKCFLFYRSRLLLKFLRFLAWKTPLFMSENVAAQLFVWLFGKKFTWRIFFSVCPLDFANKTKPHSLRPPNKQNQTNETAKKPKRNFMSSSCSTTLHPSLHPPCIFASIFASTLHPFVICQNSSSPLYFPPFSPLLALDTSDALIQMRWFPAGIVVVLDLFLRVWTCRIDA